MKTEKGQSLVEFVGIVFLLAVAALIFIALIGPGVRGVLNSPAIADIGAQADLALYTPNDVETGVDVLLDTYVQDDTHGPLRHEDVYNEVVSACKSPSHQLWVRPTKRVDVCYVNPLAGWGFQVWKRIGGSDKNPLWSERTAYIREEIVTYDDLLNFAKQNNLTLKEMVNGQWITIFTP